MSEMTYLQTACNMCGTNIRINNFRFRVSLVPIKGGYPFFIPTILIWEFFYSRMVLNSEKSYANCFIFITFVVVLGKN